MPSAVVSDDLLVQQTDAFVAAADPRVAVVRLTEEVQPVDAGDRLADPGLVHDVERRVVQQPPVPRPDDVEREPIECLADGIEAPDRHRDLQVLVLPGRLATEQVERPPGRHAPRDVNAGQPPGHLQRMPRVPRRVLPHLEPAGWELLLGRVHA